MRAVSLKRGLVPPARSLSLFVLFFFKVNETSGELAAVGEAPRNRNWKRPAKAGA